MARVERRYLPKNWSSVVINLILMQGPDGFLESEEISYYLSPLGANTLSYRGDGSELQTTRADNPYLDAIVGHVEELEGVDVAQLQRHVVELVVGQVQAAQRLEVLELGRQAAQAVVAEGQALQVQQQGHLRRNLVSPSFTFLSCS